MMKWEELRYKGGKSVKKYTFTVEDISNIVGKSQKTVRLHAKEGKVEFGNLKSVVDYCAKNGQNR